MAPLTNIINKHSIKYHCYADDTQIYLQCANNTTAVQEAITRMLNWYQPARTLRSVSTTSLVPNRNRTIRYGRRLLDTLSTALWNPLPDYIKSADTIITFETYLKTYMFII